MKLDSYYILWTMKRQKYGHCNISRNSLMGFWSNYTTLACAAIIQHLHGQQLCITCLCSNHASLTCATIIQYSHVQQSYITWMCSNYASLVCAAIIHHLCVTLTLCLKARQLATQAAAEWFLSVPGEAKVSLIQTVLQHTLLDLFSLERCLKRGLCCQASAMRLWILFWASYGLSPRNVAISLQSGGWFEFRYRGVCACVRACTHMHMAGVLVWDGCTLFARPFLIWAVALLHSLLREESVSLCAKQVKVTGLASCSVLLLFPFLESASRPRCYLNIWGHPDTPERKQNRNGPVLGQLRSVWSLGKPLHPSRLKRTVV